MSGRIHGDLLRPLYILADKKTTRYFEALGEAVDVDSEAYCFPVRGCSPLARLATEICFLLKSWGEMYYETRKSRKRGPKG